jgi:hypothetical protein
MIFRFSRAQRSGRRTFVGALVLAMLLLGVAASFAYAGEDGEPAGPQDQFGGLLPPAHASTAPVVNGTPIDGQTLTRTPADWGGQAVGITVDWLRCDADGLNCFFTGDHDNNYTLTGADVGHKIRVRERATGLLGFREKDSNATALVAGIPPTNNPGFPPAFTGTAKVGQTLTRTTKGSWSGSTPITLVSQWQRCEAAGSPCVDVGTLDSATYVLTAADLGKRIKLVVHASGPGGTADAESGLTAAVVADPPVNTALPGISGTARDGQTLTSTTGTWTQVGPAPTSFARQWQRCTVPANVCTDIPSATGPTYLLTPADVGRKIQVMVTATGSFGSATATSAQTATVVSLPPTSTSAPSITGTPKAGQTLTGHVGTWSGTPPLNFAQKWQRCNSSGGACVDIATGLTYQLTNNEIGGTVRFVDTATGPDASTSASALSAVIGTDPPVNSALPAINDTTPTDGQTLTTTDGTWGGPGAPFEFHYQWQRCSTSCTDVGTDSSSYAVVSADVGQKIRVQVIAFGSFGVATATSAQTSTVVALPPSNTTPPTINAASGIGQTVSLDDPGVWTGTNLGAPTYKWQRCTTPTSCADIAGATNPAGYVLATADVGNTVRLAETRTGPGGTATAFSAQTPTVVSDPPNNNTPPSIDDVTPEVGQTLNVNDGAWSNPTPSGFSRKWQRCTVPGNVCTDIAGATGSSYVVVAADSGNKLQVVVTANGPFGNSAPITTAQTAAVVANPPDNSAPPAIDDATPQDGQTLNVNDGTWSNPTPSSFSRKWQRCTVPGNVCTDIAGATGSSYTATSADYQLKLQVVVTANGPFGNSAPVTSAQTAAVSVKPPANTAGPTISGSAARGITLTANKGTWAGTTPLNFTYQWIRCDSNGANCNDIPSETGATYKLEQVDVGNKVKVRVTATGPESSASADSAPTAVVTQPVAPTNQGAPSIAGTTSEGNALFASPGFWAGTAPIGFAYKWSRCSTSGCTDVPGFGQVYGLTAADVGKRVRVTVTASNLAGSATAESALSAVIAARATTPPPTTPPKKKKPTKLKPFPKVQIGGIVAPAGAFLNVFRIVNAPKGSKIAVRCKGRVCPFKSTKLTARKKRVSVKRILGRPLFVGTVIEVRITKKGFVGKYVRFKIRSNRAPARTDACLQPGKTKPSKCPKN